MPSSKTILKMLDKIEKKFCRGVIQKELNILSWQTVYYWRIKDSVPKKYWHIIEGLHERT